VLASRRSRTLVVAVAAVVALIGWVALAGLASAAPNPPGNNGTVKIDELPFDDAPDNEPHVGCIFQVDFYGFDQGDLNAEVTFAAHPPTGPVQELLTDTVFIGEDDNAGGGSRAGLDASETYTLAFTGIEPHPKQGYHVKLTVHADGSQGADVKHKVFWVTGCGPGSTTTTTTTSVPGGSGTTTTTTTTGVTGTSGASATSHETSTTSEVAGASSTAPGGPSGGGLPFTGAGTSSLLVAALALLGLGAATLLGTARRGRRT
jgi:hypothetical protein